MSWTHPFPSFSFSSSSPPSSSECLSCDRSTAGGSLLNHVLFLLLRGFSHGRHSTLHPSQIDDPFLALVAPSSIESCSLPSSSYTANSYSRCALSPRYGLSSMATLCVLSCWIFCGCVCGCGRGCLRACGKEVIRVCPFFRCQIFNWGCAELYPTSIRSTALGLCVCSSKGANLVSPLLAGFLQDGVTSGCRCFFLRFACASARIPW